MNGATQKKMFRAKMFFWSFAEAMPGPISKPVTMLNGWILTEMNQEPSIALSLILWHCHYAGHIVLLLTMFLF
jgi:hypothetical protein